MRDHGGDIDMALRTYGGRRDEWIDLSTGINRISYSVPAIDPSYWCSLPLRSEINELQDLARRQFAASGSVVALAGAQAAIQIIPLLDRPGRARVLSPTYNEHASALHRRGWQVEDVSQLEDLAGADIAVVVNPNNPDGRMHDPEKLVWLSARVGRLIVDESFIDPYPGLSFAPLIGSSLSIVLRSIGKFYGLPGVRLGFAIANPKEAERIAGLAGPWPISGAAIVIGTTVLTDSSWHAATAARLAAGSQRLDQLAAAAGWSLFGGTHLFRLYETPDAQAAKERLARAMIWSRSFPWSQRLLRLGLPGEEPEWDRLKAVLEDAYLQQRS